MKYSVRQGLLAGLLGTIGDVLLHSVSFRIFKTTTTAHYLSQLIFPDKSINLLRYLIGLLAHFSAGAFGGVVLAFIFKYLGEDYPYDKGIGLGVLLWLVHVIVIPNIINAPRPIIFRTEVECIVDLTAHVFFGIIATAFLTGNARVKKR